MRVRRRLRTGCDCKDDVLLCHALVAVPDSAVAEERAEVPDGLHGAEDEDESKDIAGLVGEVAVWVVEEGVALGRHGRIAEAALGVERLGHLAALACAVRRRLVGSHWR